MKKVLKGYDVYFTLKSPACVLIGAYSEEEAREQAEKVLTNMSQPELIDRLLAAVDFDGLKIEYIEEVDELEE
jgi:ATP-dependent Clp protease ATP-binding subunit ClpA